MLLEQREERAAKSRVLKGQVSGAQERQVLGRSA